MELMQLQMLVAIAEEGNLQKAGGRVFRTAPALSMAMNKLQHEIGTRLFDRSDSRDYRLTACGEVLVDYARRLISLRDEALAAVEEIRNVRRGHLRIGANESITDYVLPSLTKIFREQHPGVKVEVATGHSDSLLRALKHHELDLALVAYEPRDKSLEGQPLMHDTLVAIMRPTHRLAGQDVICIQELRAEPLIIENASSSLRERIASEFRRLHIPLNVRVETGTIESIKKMVEKDMGVGIIPRMCVRNEEARGDLVARKIEGLREERTLWVVRRRGLSPASQAFMKTIGSTMTAPRPDRCGTVAVLEPKRCRRDYPADGSTSEHFKHAAAGSGIDLF